MIATIERILEGLDTSRLTRRQAASYIAATALAAGAAGPAAASTEKATFKAKGLNHLALKVGDVARSRDFYRDHLGLTVTRDNAPNNCFMGCGDNFVALFGSDSPGMHHYCYTIDDYEPDAVQARLKKAGFESRRQENRVYFDDPDGLIVQLAGRWSAWPGPRPRHT